ncbi:WbuC family cupin fold metalloprotein [Carboxylicivirga taeanensis]|uniref:WbuC family cupin fold metalloprotein n=1 Tax=Carboxylicivirga taeanensis TaxID=1416875 RepID=UPI003F6DC5F4
MLIDDALLNTLSQNAKNSPRKRVNHNIHTSEDDLLQRMINVLQPGSYVRPHKHEQPAKREAFIILSGSLLVVLFDESGELANSYVLSRDKGNYGIEIPPGTYHTIIALEANTGVYELKDGPYDPVSDKHFASWAPPETDDAAADYLRLIIKKATLS